MSYFERNYLGLTFPVVTSLGTGFREAQRGALFALGMMTPTFAELPSGE